MVIRVRVRVIQVMVMVMVIRVRVIVVRAMVMRVVVRRAGGEPATDETVFMLVGRFPAITSLEFKLVSNHAWNVMTDEGMRAVCSLTALTTLDLAWCVLVSGLRALIN